MTDSTSPAQPSRRDLRWVIAGLLAVGTLLLYLHVAQHAFLHFDDHHYVTENPWVRAGLTWPGLAWAFSTNHAANWHPLTWLSHMLDVELFGLSPGPHHVVNAVLHAANAALLFLALLRMTAAPGRSAFVAVLFAVHPLHVESVAWLAERKDVLSTFFGFLMLWAYARYAERPGARRYAAVVVLFALSLLAKPMLVTAPFLLLLLDLWPLGRVAGLSPPASGPHPQASWPARRLVLEKLPLLALSAASCAVTLVAQGGSGAFAGDALGLGARLGNAALSYLRYLEKTLLPTSLAAFYPHPGAIPLWQSMGSAVVLVAVTALALRLLRTRPWVAVGWLWFLGTLVPVIGLVQVGAQAMADRYGYLPLVGLFVVVAWEAEALLGRLRSGRAALWVGAVAVVAVLGVTTWRQILHWTDHETLFRHALAVTADNPRAHEILSGELVRNGKVEEAFLHARETTRLQPRNARVWYNLGVLLREAGRLDEAREALQEALRIDPGDGKAWANLGGVELQSGRTADAERAFREGVRAAPQDAMSWFGLGSFLGRAGQVPEAIEAYRESLRLDPGSMQAWSNLAVAYLAAGRIDEAGDAFRAAVRARPDDPTGWRNLGAFMSRNGQLPEAADALREALRLRPRDPDALHRLGLVYAALHQRAEALQIGAQLQAIDPARANDLMGRIGGE